MVKSILNFITKNQFIFSLFFLLFSFFIAALIFEIEAPEQKQVILSFYSAFFAFIGIAIFTGSLIDQIIEYKKISK